MEEKNKKNSYYSFLSLITWFWFFRYVTSLDRKIFTKDQLGNIETLKKSPFARGMFIDVGILSTIISTWIFSNPSFKYKNIFAIIGMFVGSFAFLPFFAIYFFLKFLRNTN